MILLAVMIKLMKVVWSEVAILVITVLCSDLNPAALLSQPEHPHASNGCGNDHSTDCTAVLLNLRPEFKRDGTNHPGSNYGLAGMLKSPSFAVLISWIINTVRW